MRIKCSKCGKSVSSEVPNETVIAAWTKCIDCVQKENENPEITVEELRSILETFYNECIRTQGEITVNQLSLLYAMRTKQYLEAIFK